MTISGSASCTVVLRNNCRLPRLFSARVGRIVNEDGSRMVTFMLEPGQRVQWDSASGVVWVFDGNDWHVTPEGWVKHTWRNEWNTL